MEDLYQKKDMLMVLFNLIDFNHSGFISRNEFSDVVKLLLNDEKNPGTLSDAYIDELASAMDIDKNGKIDVNEFLGSILLLSENFSSVRVFFLFRKLPNRQRQEKA